MHKSTCQVCYQLQKAENLLPIAVFPSGQVDFQGEIFWPYLGGSRGMLSQKILKILLLRLARIAFVAYRQQKRLQKSTINQKISVFLKIFGTILNFVRNLTFPGVL